MNLEVAHFNAKSHQMSATTWHELHELATKAAAAAWEYERDHVRGEEAPHGPFRWKRQRVRQHYSDQKEWYRLQCDVGASWVEPRHGQDTSKLFFVVEQNLDERQLKNRLSVDCRGFHEGTLYLGVPDATAQYLPRQEHELRVFRTNSSEDLARRWVGAIDDLTHGEQLVNLWTRDPAVPPPWTHEHLPMDETLNQGQARALHHATSPGGYFIWGPPGTGKTTVISTVILHSLKEGKSVLLTSHTHVAVDNALNSVLRSDSTHRLGLVTPGEVIRKAPGRLDKVDDSIRSHPFLLDDRAAAVIVRRDARLTEIDARMQANEHHPDRAREQELGDRVHQLDPHDQGVRQLFKQHNDFLQWRDVSERGQALQHEFEECLADIELGQEKLDQLTAPGNDIIQQRQRVSKEARDAALRRDALTHECQSLSDEANQEAHRAREFRRQQSTAATGFVLPWKRAAKQQRVSELAYAAQACEMRASQLTDRVASRSTELSHVQDHEHRLSAAAAGLAAEAQEIDRIKDDLAEARRRHDILDHDRQKLAEQRQALEGILGDPDLWLSRYAQAVADGSYQVMQEWDEAIALVDQLNIAKDELELDRSRVNQDYRNKRRDLLSTAPVIATTLDSLVYSDELMSRRFDVVIIDEVASAQAFKVLYAAAKADVTCVLVGDFLQNSPVAEAEDPATEKDRATVAWQTSDIFTLDGITDKATALHHPHCASLSTQYRFPPLIATAVNRLCYDDLLRTGRSWDDDTTVFFHDTSALDVVFERDDRSWRCQRTLALAEEIARSEKTEATAGAVTGFVTPYRAQAKLAKQWFATQARQDLAVECGTVHTFQGREFETVIVDLMQDANQRWISVADAKSPDVQARGAARLLNVALTRTTRRLHLIGNWEYISTCPTPGMTTLTQMADGPGFLLIRHT